MYIAGETGVVYKGVLMECRGQPAQAIALKTLKGLYDCELLWNLDKSSYIYNQYINHKIIVISLGLFSSSDIQFLINEIIKMKDFDHPHVMPLIGVCLDAGPGMSMVMPYMANGSLLDYLKKNRSDLKLSDDSREQVCQC